MVNVPQTETQARTSASPPATPIGAQPTRRAMAIFYAICFGISCAVCAAGLLATFAFAWLQP